MDERVSCAERLLGLAARFGADYIFANLGSDHPAFIEAFARMAARGESRPEIVICPHEMTALSAAHGYAMLTRRPQLVLVHVDVGTQNLGGSVHNAARGRVPAIVVAGLSPVTENAGIPGGRNEFIHDLQDAPRQREIVSQYMKWTYEMRAADSVDGVVARAVQIATAEPQGPVYLTGAREVWEAPAPSSEADLSHWPTPRLGGLPSDAVARIAEALTASTHPLAITSYLGRNPESVGKLVELSDRLGIGVTEVSPTYLNFPGNHPHHLGYRRNTLVSEADLILLLDVDVPWLKSSTRPAPDTRVIHVDIDPIKTGVGFWHYPCHDVYQADTREALGQLLEAVGENPTGSPDRKRRIGSARDALPGPGAAPDDGPITAEELCRALGELVTEKTVVVFEAPTATEIVPAALGLSRPGSYLNSGGTGLGWGINAALGVRLARPEAEVIALVGDGCYQFGVPGSAYWVAARYRLPFLTVIFDNGGWSAPRFSTLGVHPRGLAAREDTFWSTMTSGTRLARMAAAAGEVAAFEVTDRAELARTLESGIATVRAGTPAVVDVRLAPFSSQILGRSAS